MAASNSSAALGSVGSGIALVLESVKLPRYRSHQRRSFNLAHPSLQRGLTRFSYGSSNANDSASAESRVASSPKRSMKRHIARVAIALRNSLYAMIKPKPNN